jgi:ABC-type glycerol-3-phosphate transport system substrate-binding protein
MRTRWWTLAVLAAVIALALAACGGGEEAATTEEAPPAETAAPAETGAPADTGAAGGEEAAGDVSGTLEVTAVWSGDEQAAFEAVLDGFTEQYPDVTVNYTSAGDQLPTVLSTAVEGGNPPDLAAVPQPGLVAGFAEQGAIQPLDFAQQTILDNFGQSVVDVGSVDGTLYGLLFKAANKSTVWYNVPVFEDAGVTAPATWDELVAGAGTIAASGVPPYSIGGADGWTLTDLFENIYLRQAGEDMYDQLAAHEIPWTDQSVKDALTTMAEIVGNPDDIAGGTQGALQTDFPTSVSQVYADPPKASMVFEGDFVAGVILEQTNAEPETGFNVFEFPSIDDSAPAIVGGGDTIVMFKDSPAAQALVEYLASPEAAAIWAERGGFASLNKNLDPNVYPDAITQATASALQEAEVFRFDLSDLQPAEFGATVGSGMWKLFQDFVQNPTDVDGTAQQLEDAAAAAYGS